MHVNSSSVFVYNGAVGHPVPPGFKIEGKDLNISNFELWTLELIGDIVRIANTVFHRNITANVKFFSNNCTVPKVMTGDQNGEAVNHTKITDVEIYSKDEITPKFHVMRHSKIEKITFVGKQGIVYCDSSSAVKTIVNGRLVKV